MSQHNLTNTGKTTIEQQMNMLIKHSRWCREYTTIHYCLIVVFLDFFRPINKPLSSVYNQNYRVTK